MPRSYRHLTFEERCQVKNPKKSGLSKGSIALQTGNGDVNVSVLNISVMPPFCRLDLFDRAPFPRG